MPELSAEWLEKIRQHFDTAPYPRVPLEFFPKDDIKGFYPFDLVVPYYLRDHRVVQTRDRVILDAGCGSGYKALILAETNPGARIVGVDLSPESVKLAQARLQYHGFENAEFHAMAIEDLPRLGLEFDLINCDEVLYLLPDPVLGLQTMKSVLKPDGMIRANFHHRLQRSLYYQAQEFFTRVGLMDQAPDETTIGTVRAVMKALKDHVTLKARIWNQTLETDDHFLLANYLLRGDKGITILEFFDLLRGAGLEFISMVNWWDWDLVDLFTDVTELPMEVALCLAEKSPEEQLHLYALLHPQHRLLDLWCGHPGQGQPSRPADDWTDADWQQVTVHLYPRLQRSLVRDRMIEAIAASSFFEISQFLPRKDVLSLDSLLAATLLPLFNQPQSLMALAQRWLHLRPVNLLTGEPTTQAEAIAFMQQNLPELERQGCVMLVRSLDH